jgi:hypothetical protein
MSRFAWVHIVVTLAVMAVLASPIAPVFAAQDITCEEGQVVDEETGECVDPPFEEADDTSTDSTGEDMSGDEASEDDTTADDSLMDDAEDASNDSSMDDDSGDDVSEDASVEDDASNDGSGDASMDDGTDDASMDGTGDAPDTVTNVVLHTFACPEGWDVEAEGLDASYYPCQTQPDQPTSYTVSGPGGISLELEGMGDLEAATAYGPELPPGTWTISQSTSGAAWANCLVFDTEGVQYNSVTGPVAGQSLTFDLVAGDWLECEWFTNAGGGAMPQGEPLLALNVQSYICPYGYAVTQGRETLAAGCNLKAANGTVTFVAIVDGVEVARGSAPGDDYFVESMTPYDSGFPSGAWRIEHILPDGYSAGIVYCEASPGTGEPRTSADSGTSDGVSITVQPGEELRCVGYAIEKEPRAGAARGMTFVGHLCPEGTLRARASVETCTLIFGDSPAYVEYDVHAPNGTLAGTSGLAPDTTSTTIAAVDTSGTWSVVFRTNGGRPLPELECTGQLSDGRVQPLRVAESPVGTEVTVGVDHAVTCHVLMFVDYDVDDQPTDDDVDPAGDDTAPADGEDEPAEDETGSTDAGSSDDTTAQPEPVDPITTVTLQSWMCPTDMSANASLEELLFTCTASDETIEFSVGSGDPVPAYAASVAWCSMNYEDDGMDTFPVAFFPDTSGNLPLDLIAPAAVYCDLFAFGAI